MALYSFGTTATRRVLPEDPVVPFFVINMLVGAVSGVVAQTIFYAGERNLLLSSCFDYFFNVIIR